MGLLSKKCWVWDVEAEECADNALVVMCGVEERRSSTVEEVLNRARARITVLAASMEWV